MADFKGFFNSKNGKVAMALQVTEVGDNTFTGVHSGVSKKGQPFTANETVHLNGKKPPKVGDIVLVYGVAKEERGHIDGQFVTKEGFIPLKGNKSSDKKWEQYDSNFYLGYVMAVKFSDDGRRANIAVSQGKDKDGNYLPTRWVTVWNNEDRGGENLVKEAEKLVPQEKDEGLYRPLVLVNAGEVKKTTKDGKEYENVSAFSFEVVGGRMEKKKEATESDDDFMPVPDGDDGFPW